MNKETKKTVIVYEALWSNFTACKRIQVIAKGRIQDESDKEKIKRHLADNLLKVLNKEVSRLQIEREIQLHSVCLLCLSVCLLLSINLII